MTEILWIDPANTLQPTCKVSLHVNIPYYAAPIHLVYVSPPLWCHLPSLFAEANNTVDAGRTSPHTHTTPPHLTMGSTSPTSQQLLSSVVALSPHHYHHSPPPPPGSPPHHSLDFESGRVLGQLPYEYSSFLDLPPAALGKRMWEFSCRRVEGGLHIVSSLTLSA